MRPTVIHCLFPKQDGLDVIAIASHVSEIEHAWLEVPFVERDGPPMALMS